MSAILPLDAELAQPHRLAIALVLASAPGGRTGFSDLVERLGLSEGNLACHLRRLQRGRVVEASRNGARGRASRTEFFLTAAGRVRLAAVRREMVSIAYAIGAELDRTGATGPVGVADTELALASMSISPSTPALAPDIQAPAVPPESLIDERFSGPD